MSRPSILHVGETLYWVIRTLDPDTGVLKDADADPTVVVRKNGSSTGDSVTITKRAATTGIYDCSYNPAGETEGDQYTIEETADITGTTTASAEYQNSWAFNVVAPKTELADAILSRNVSNVESSIDEHTLGTIILSLLEWSISGSTLTIKRTDGTTVHFTKTISSANSGDQVITGLN